MGYDKLLIGEVRPSLSQDGGLVAHVLVSMSVRYGEVELSYACLPTGKGRYVPWCGW